MIWTLRFIIPVLRLGSRQPYEIDGCYVYPHVQMRKLRQQSKKLLRDTKPGMQGWDSNVGSVALLSGTALNHYATSKCWLMLPNLQMEKLKRLPKVTKKRLC